MQFTNIVEKLESLKNTENIANDALRKLTGIKVQKMFRT